MTMIAGLPTCFAGINSEYIARPDECEGVTIGAGEDARKVSQSFRAALQDFFLPASREITSRRAVFMHLASEWKRDTAVLSSVHAIALHPAYQRIIGMGREALPWILEELSHRPDHWFWALTSITGVDPVPPNDRGNLQRMAGAWLKWGRGQGFTD